MKPSARQDIGRISYDEKARSKENIRSNGDSRYSGNSRLSCENSRHSVLGGRMDDRAEDVGQGKPMGRDLQRIDSGGGKALAGGKENLLINDEEDDPGETNSQCDAQSHVHEFVGSTKLAQFEEDVHNHRFAGVSGEEITIKGSHIHKIFTRTDFFDHFHIICHYTGPAVYVEEGEEVECQYCGRKKKERKHVHFVEGCTTLEDGHKHEFQCATMIESPLLPQPNDDDCKPRCQV